MTISEMIKNLATILEEYGDLDCWYAKDDEGNEYQEIFYKPSVYYVREEDGYMCQYLDEDEMEDEEIKDFKEVCIVN